MPKRTPESFSPDQTVPIRPAGWNNDHLLLDIGRDRWEVAVTSLRRVGPAPVQGARAQAELFRSRPAWTEAEVRAGGHPLYWSREWLATQLSRMRITDLAQIVPYSRAVLTKWKRVHGIQDPVAERVRAAWAEGAFESYRELADHLHLSESVISAAVGASRRVHDPALDERLRLVEAVIRAGARTPKQAHEQLPHLRYGQVYRAWRRLKQVPKGE